ncbi:sulfite oxidase-like oxidoreductase [Pseudomonas moraviensis]|uniref:sulfite oxidase-like oxidoreductase n=1 Tax=Pseudomonas moraviensis TaxID=321662 RepID=UPI0022C4F2EF|nr:sulfite oxidase-like oxidoreductase [Pseudomonas moraviensis]GLH36327.1 sulfite oxidase-like oxidoreductase [Pseudomonas moraviensis]
MHTKASRLRKSRSPKVDPASGNRLPPGQVLTERFPILHEGAVPEYDTGDWSLRLFGTLDRPIELRYADLQALPQRVLRCDIHCVTRWSKFDTEWGGVHLQDLLQAFDIQPTSSYVMAHADPDYQTNLLLADLLHPQSLLATHYAGQPLTAQHGWPLRVVIAGRYFWKSAKWLRGLEFVAQEQPGFWEQNGFHLHADPFAEQRFSGGELDIAEDAWLEKKFD